METSMQNIDRLQLIREKIVRTDEVLKLILEKNEMLEQWNIKYKETLRKYFEICKQYKKLKEECDILCMSNDEQQHKISKLEEELNLRKTEYDTLNDTYVEHVNTSLLQYQTISTKLTDSQNTVKEQEKRIALLEAVRKNGQKLCRSCGKAMRRTVKRNKTSSEEGSESDTTNEISTRLDGHPETNENTMFVIEAKTEISSLQNALSLIRLDNEKLRSDLQKMEDDRNMLRANNTSLKRNVKEAEKKNVKLQERINALMLEEELRNLDHTEKRDTHDIGVQTKYTDVDDDVASEVVNDFCDQHIYLPRLISPIEEFEHEEDVSKAITRADERISTESLSRQSPVFNDTPCVNPEWIDSEILNTSFSSVHSEKLLDTGQLSSKCCSDYAASMQDDDLGESRLRGFVPLSVLEKEECDTKVIQKRNIKRKKGFMKRCSDQIYKRVLNDVLKYIHSRRRKLFVKNRIKRIQYRPRNTKIIPKEYKVISKKERKQIKKNLQNKRTTSRKTNLNSTQDNPHDHSYFCYDAPPDSVDSGYSAQMSTESECSESLYSKFSERIPELNVQQSTDDCDNKKTKIELFGSDSESDNETSASRSSNLKSDNKVQSDDDMTGPKRRKSGDNSNRKYNVSNNTKTNRYSNCLTSRGNEEQKNQQVLRKPVLLSSDIIPQSDNSESNNAVKPAIIKKKIESDCERRVFKRPNCRKRVIETPRSPEPVQEQDVLPQKPVIIPLNKPKQLGAATISKLFQKLLTYPDEPQILEEVSNKLSDQEPAWIARVIIDVVNADYHSKVENRDNPLAPLLTFKQKVLLGVMVNLEMKNMSNIIIAFMFECEKRILQEKSIEHITPLTGLYLAVCKMRKDVHRIRKTCLDALYFMGDLVIPFLYTVLSSWPEVLPTQNESIGSILPKVIVQVINLKTCNYPGYNLLNLRTVISRLHGYPSERWNSDELFTEIVSIFKEDPNRQDAMVALVILCKNHSPSWVIEKLEKLTDVVISTPENSLLKQRTLDILCKVVKQFDEATDSASIEKVETCKSRLSNT